MWIFPKYCNSLGIPTPICYGVFHREYGFDESEKPLRDLPSLSGLLDSVGGAIVVKPLAGDRGDNVRVFDGIDPARQVGVATDGTACSHRQLHDMLARKRAVTGKWV